MIHLCGGAPFQPFLLTDHHLQRPWETEGPNVQYKKAGQSFLLRVGAILDTNTHTQDAQTDKAPHIWSTSAWRYRVYHGVHVVARVGRI